MAKAKVATETETTGSALAVVGGDVLAALGEDFDFADGGFGFDQQFKIPSVKFNDDDHPGEIYNKTTEESADAIEAIFLYAQQYRDYSVSPDGGKQYDRICSTSDTRAGFGMVEATGEERTCKTCPHARWKEDDGKRVPPDCSEGFAVVGMDTNTEAMFLARFQKTGYKAFSRLRPKYHGPQKFGGRRLRELPLWMRRYVLRVEKVPGEKYYLPVIEPSDPAIIEADQARDVYDAAKLVEENMGQVLAFHRDAPVEEAATTTAPASSDYAAEAGASFVDG